MEQKLTPEELLEYAGATNQTHAPSDVINAITKGTVPDATPVLSRVKEAPTPEEKKITEGEVFKPSKLLREWLTTTGEKKAQPIRNPASAFFNINSIDRYASVANPIAQFALITTPPTELAATPASSYNMNLGRNLMSGYFHRLTVTDVNVDWNIPTICAQNYIFTFGVQNVALATSAAAVVTLPFRYVTFNELASLLQLRIRDVFNATNYSVDALTVAWTDNTAGLDLNVNLGNESGFVFFSNDVNKKISFISDFPASYTGVPGVLFPNEGSIIPGTSISQARRAMYKFYTMMGITSSILNNLTGAFITNPSYPTLIYTSYIDIISNKLSQFMRVKDSETSWSADTNVITRVYLTNQGTVTSPTVIYTDLSGNQPTQIIRFDEFGVGSRPFILNYTPQTPKNIKWSPSQTIVDFDIRVVDEFGDVLPWDLAIPFVLNPVTAQTSYSPQFFEFQLTVLCSET
jgi:hypothetical protein